MAFHNKRHYNPNVVPKKRTGVAPPIYWVFAKNDKRNVALWVDPAQTVHSLARDLSTQIAKVDGLSDTKYTLWLPPSDDTSSFTKLEENKSVSEYDLKDGAYIVYTKNDDEPQQPAEWNPKLPDLTIIPNEATDDPEPTEASSAAASSSS